MHDIRRGFIHNTLESFELKTNTVINVRNVVRKMLDKEAMTGEEEVDEGETSGEDENGKPAVKTVKRTLNKYALFLLNLKIGEDETVADTLHLMKTRIIGPRSTTSPSTSLSTARAATTRIAAAHSMTNIP